MQLTIDFSPGAQSTLIRDKMVESGALACLVHSLITHVNNFLFTYMVQLYRLDCGFV